jgi:hypothetical protein
LAEAPGSEITTLGITPDTFPIFLTYDVYLTVHHSCCIGGYHSATGSTNAPQSYAHFTYVDLVGAFSQDVSALSHEVGEWADDPLVVNLNGNPTCPWRIVISRMIPEDSRPLRPCDARSSGSSHPPLYTDCW